MITLSELEGGLVGIGHLGKSENLRLESIPRKAVNISGTEQAGQTKGKDACVASSRKESTADGGPTEVSKRDRKTES